jgi:serine O-acetyltransferase
MINAYRFYYISHCLFRWKLELFSKLFKLFIFLFYNSSIPYQAKIGKGTKFAYGGIGVIIHKRAVIGSNCNIGSNVTIGGRSNHQSVPVIGDRVYIGTGAKILGPVTIGDDVKIGANAVVLMDVPDNVTAVGVPAKIISREDIS